MSKDAKDSKHKPDGLRQPQRKDSLSSVLSWAALQGKITTSKAPTATPSPQPSPGTGSRPRRHSHSTSTSTETKTKARRGSTTFRRLSFSLSATIQDGASTKTRHAKTSMTPDLKAAPGTSKPAKDGSSDKVSKAAPDTDGKHTVPPRPQSAGDKPRSSPLPMPKSILRVSSPDGYRRPRQFVSPETGEPTTSPGATPPSSPPQPFFTPLSPDSSPPPPTSPSPSPPPPTSPIDRPMSPGATVRFAKATIHRVDVGPGRRRFLPVKRKSKSTLTYISPLDPGTQKSAPRTMLQSPTKLRRHQENQAAMGRYWLRTEEEEAQWRAEAERRAEEEAERYRNEPPACSPSAAVGVVEREDGEGAEKLSLSLEKVEEGVESEDEDTDEEAGAKCNVEDEAGSVTLKGPEGNSGGEGEIKATPQQTTPEPASPNPATTATAPQEPAARPAVIATTAPAQTATAETSNPAESKSFSERLAEKQAAESRAHQAASPTTPARAPEASPQPSAESSKSARSSSGSLTKAQSAAAGAVSGRSSSSSTSTSSSSSSSTRSAEQLSRTPSREKEKESEKDKDKAREKPRTVSTTTSSSSSRSTMNNLRSGGGGGGAGGDRTQKLYTSRSAGAHHSTSQGSSNSNHLHLSGRRGRRSYFEDHKQGITA